MPINIDDKSGDRNYFTIIPNYILNHSTATDQALYMQMKRITGDNGKCAASMRYFSKQLKVGNKTIYNSIKYLIEHKWITFVGKKQVFTDSGKQLVNTYEVNDIWKMNTDYYIDKGVAKQQHLNKQGVSENTSRCFSKDPKVLPVGKQSKNIKKELLSKNRSTSSVNTFLNSFQKLNPSYKQLFSNVTQRAAAERLLESHSLEKLENLLQVIPQTNQMKYAPVITTPLQLEDKFATLLIFIKKEQLNPQVIKL